MNPSSRRGPVPRRAVVSVGRDNFVHPRCCTQEALSAWRAGFCTRPVLPSPDAFPGRLAAVLSSHRMPGARGGRRLARFAAARGAIAGEPRWRHGPRTSRRDCCQPREITQESIGRGQKGPSLRVLGNGDWPLGSARCRAALRGCLGGLRSAGVAEDDPEYGPVSPCDLSGPVAHRVPPVSVVAGYGPVPPRKTIPVPGSAGR
jgi:hypothetical protein